MATGSPERSLIAATRGPSWAATLAAVLVLVGALDALLSYQAFALFLDADLLGTGARDAAERQAGLVGGINALAATGILTMLCIVLPQVAARLLRGDQGPTLARMPRWLRCALAALFMVAALVLAAGIGAVRYMGQLSMPSDTVCSSFAVEALEAAGLSGGAQVDATALVWSAFTAFLLFLAEMLGFALACVKGGEAARRQARLIRMERRAADLEERSKTLAERADKVEADALRQVEACEAAFASEVDERLGALLMRHRPRDARGMVDWL